MDRDEQVDYIARVLHTAAVHPHQAMTRGNAYAREQDKIPLPDTLELLADAAPVLREIVQDLILKNQNILCYRHHQSIQI